MSKALERTGNRMDEALARIRQEREARRSQSPSPSPSYSNSSFAAPERVAVAPHVYLHRSVCAVFDLWFVERFERQASGLYRMVETIRIHDGDGSTLGECQSQALSLRKIEGRYLPCPWCGDKAGKRYHCSCGASVCGGKVKGNHFVCRDSCGDEWDLGPPVHEIQVSEAKPNSNDWKPGERSHRTWQAPPRDVKPERLLLPPARRR